MFSSGLLQPQHSMIIWELLYLSNYFCTLSNIQSGYFIDNGLSIFQDLIHVAPSFSFPWPI